MELIAYVLSILLSSVLTR